jgi:bifunctional DNase/RNase
MSSEIKLSVVGLVYNQTLVGTYGLILSEEDGNRRFSVMIGEPEAQSIALKINNRKSPRPLAHDLIRSILLEFDAKLEKVLIYDMINDVFFSELHIQANNRKIVIDARTSDAVALAVRSESPIFIRNEILDIVGAEIDVNPKQPTNIDTEDLAIENLSDSDLNEFTKEELDDLLKKAIEQEQYELAVNIRDAIARKST